MAILDISIDRYNRVVTLPLSSDMGIYYKLKYTPSSCETEGFVETRLCKLSVILRSRVLRVVCPHEGYRSRLPLQPQISYQGQQGDVRQSVRVNYIYKKRFGGGQKLTAVEGNGSFYQVNLVSRISGEGDMHEYLEALPTVRTPNQRF